MSRSTTWIKFGWALPPEEREQVDCREQWDALIQILKKEADGLVFVPAGDVLDVDELELVLGSEIGVPIATVATQPSSGPARDLDVYPLTPKLLRAVQQRGFNEVWTADAEPVCDEYVFTRNGRPWLQAAPVEGLLVLPKRTQQELDVFWKALPTMKLFDWATAPDPSK